MGRDLRRARVCALVPGYERARHVEHLHVPCTPESSLFSVVSFLWDVGTQVRACKARGGDSCGTEPRYERANHVEVTLMLWDVGIQVRACKPRGGDSYGT